MILPSLHGFTRRRHVYILRVLSYQLKNNVNSDVATVVDYGIAYSFSSGYFLSYQLKHEQYHHFMVFHKKAVCLYPTSFVLSIEKKRRRGCCHHCELWDRLLFFKWNFFSHIILNVNNTITSWFLTRRRHVYLLL